MNSPKQLLRRQLLQARRDLNPSTRRNFNALLSQRAQALAESKAVAAYCPLDLEPGGPDFIESLHTVARSLWLPVVVRQGQLEWVEYSGPDCLRTGRWGLQEPIGPGLGPELLNQLDLIFTPAVAVNQAGYRLGKGGGYYDRALANTTTLTAAIVFDHECPKSFSPQPHDVAVSMALTPSRTYTF